MATADAKRIGCWCIYESTDEERRDGSQTDMLDQRLLMGRRKLYCSVAHGNIVSDGEACRMKVALWRISAQKQTV